METMLPLRRVGQKQMKKKDRNAGHPWKISMRRWSERRIFILRYELVDNANTERVCTSMQIFTNR